MLLFSHLALRPMSGVQLTTQPLVHWAPIKTSLQKDTAKRKTEIHFGWQIFHYKQRGGGQLGLALTVGDATCGGSAMRMKTL